MPALLETIGRAWGLDPEIYRWVMLAAEGGWVALVVVALAGISEAVGQSVVLFLNRITPRRFVLALLLSAGTHVVGFFFWAATVWLVAAYLFDQTTAYNLLTRAMGLAYAPQILSFFVLTPYLGALFSLGIGVWSLLATLTAVQVALGLTVWEALACSGLGWLLLQGWRRTLGRPLLAFQRYLQRRAAGKPLQVTLADLRTHKISTQLLQRMKLNRPRRAARPVEPPAPPPADSPSSTPTAVGADPPGEERP